MRIFTEEQYELFKQVATLSQDGLHKAMKAYLRAMYGKDKVVSSKDYVYAKGDIPIALVAHMDTVHKQIPKNIFFDRENGVIWSPEGIGADDRAGVFAIMQIIKSGLRPNIIFTRDEEIGGLGATAVAKRGNPFGKLQYLIQLDRRGEKDCVFYDCDSASFEKYIETFGFETAWGSFSDISEICPLWGVAGVNLSVGYFNEHTFSEYLRTDILLNTIDKVTEMLKQEDIPFFKYVAAPYYGHFGNYKGYIFDYDHDYYEKYYSKAYGYNTETSSATSSSFKVICSGCKNNFWEEETFPVKVINGGIKFYCPDCIANNIEWCSVCGEPFEVDKNAKDYTYTYLCPDCRESKGGNKS